MSITKKLWQNVLYIVILLVAIVLLFRWYSAANSRRIENRNLNYALDSSRQTALRIDSEFSNALQRARNYAYLLSSGNSRPEVTAELLKGMEENSSFDAIRFTDASGLNLASDGQTNDSSDRNYFISGMRGESSIEILTSRLTNQIMTVFYAPVQYDGEAVGVVLGLYFAEDYLKEMLATTYFGESADIFLCNPDGTVIASSNGESYDKPLLDILLDSGHIDAQTAEDAWAAFDKGAGNAGFICAPGSKTDNLCVSCLPSSEYVLVQAFPQSVTQAMIQDANHIGMVLQVILIGLFAVYILVLLFQAQRQRRQLERESHEHIIGLEEKGRLAQLKIAVADRKERQYRIAITATDFCTFEFNLTKDLIEQDVVRTLNGEKVSLLQKAGL